MSSSLSVRRRWPALAGILQPLWLVGAALLLGATRPGYDPLRDGISELGEAGAPTALAWNLGGFGVVALLHATYALAIRSAFGTGWLFRLTVLQATLIAASGVFRCDPGCPAVPATPLMLLHTLVGLSYFAVTVAAPLVAWRTFRRRPEWRALARWSLAAGGLLVLLFLIGPALGADRVGVWQRATLLTAGAWQASVAFRLLRLRVRGVSPGRSRAAGPA